MTTKVQQARWQHLVAGGSCLFLPLATLPTDLEFTTVASWYGPGFHGRKTASGEVYDQNKLTAANKTLPFGTKLAVKNLTNGRSCVVVINDRGPYVKGRGIDLSKEAARRIGIVGIAPVLCRNVSASSSTPPAAKPDQTQESFESVSVAVLNAEYDRMSAASNTVHQSSAPEAVHSNSAPDAVPAVQPLTAYASRNANFIAQARTRTATVTGNKPNWRRGAHYVAYLGAKRVEGGVSSRYVRNYGA